MRHRLFGKKLGRNHHQRQALFRSLIKEMFLRGALKTTHAKAKAVIPLIEKISNTLITKSDLIARRLLFRYFQNQSQVGQIVISFRHTFPDKKSNFTQVRNIKYRQGDNAKIVGLSFVKPLSLPSQTTVKDNNKKKKATPTKNEK